MRLGRVFGIFATLIGVGVAAKAGMTWAQFAVAGMAVWAALWVLFAVFVQRVNKA